MVEPIVVQRGGSYKLPNVHLQPVGKERFLGAVEKDDVLGESQIEIVFDEIFEADAAFGGSQLLVETAKLVNHQARHTFDEVLNHLRLPFPDFGFVKPIILVLRAMVRPHLALEVLSQIHDILQKDVK